MDKLNEYSGNQFNLITISDPIVYEYRLVGKTRHLFVLGSCKCGSEPRFFYLTHLKRGNTKSCGCLLNKSKNALPDNVAGIRNTIRVYKQGARARNLEYSLTNEEAISFFKSDCFYCGGSPSNIYKSKSKTGKDFLYNGIDRKNNSKGYYKENCVPCCKICNYLKKDMEFEEFLGLIFRIAHNRSCSKLPSMGELVEKLAIANLKLFEVCSEKDKLINNNSNIDTTLLAKKDIELCKERAQLKSEINRAFYGRSAIEEIKNYGGK